MPTVPSAVESIISKINFQNFLGPTYYCFLIKALPPPSPRSYPIPIPPLPEYYQTTSPPRHPFPAVGRRAPCCMRQQRRPPWLVSTPLLSCDARRDPSPCAIVCWVPHDTTTIGTDDANELALHLGLWRALSRPSSKMDRMLRPPATKVMILLGLGHMLLRPSPPACQWLSSKPRSAPPRPRQALAFPVCLLGGMA